MTMLRANVRTVEGESPPQGWASSDPEIATVDVETGGVTALREGTVTLTYTEGQRIASWFLTVEHPGVATRVAFKDDNVPTNPEARPVVWGIPNVPNGHPRRQEGEREARAQALRRILEGEDREWGDSDRLEGVAELLESASASLVRLAAVEGLLARYLTLGSTDGKAERQPLRAELKAWLGASGGPP